MKLPPDLGPLLTVEDFLPFVGHDYVVEAGASTVTIHLDEIERRPRADWMLREPFILVFSSPADILLPEAHYRMRSANGEPVEMYLIPIASGFSDRQLYQAVFN